MPTFAVSTGHLIILHWIAIYISCILTPINLFIVQTCSALEPCMIFIVMSDVICIACSIIDGKERLFDRVMIVIDIFLCPVLVLGQYYCGNTIIIALRFIGIVRMARIMEFHRHYHIAQHMIHHGTLPFPIHKDVLRSLYYTCLFFLGIVILSCGWFFVACYTDKEECLQGNNWVAHDTILSPDDPFSIFIRSSYFITQTLFTIGYGDIHPVNEQEIVFAVFVMLCGATWNGLMISLITSILKNSNLAYILYQQDINCILEILEGNVLPEVTKQQLLDYKRMQFQKQLGLSEEQLLNRLPPVLKTQLKTYFLHSYFHSQPFLNSFIGVNNDAFVQHTKLLSLPQSFPVCSTGKHVNNIIIIRSGKIGIPFPSANNVNAHQGDANNALEMNLIQGDMLGDYETIFHKPMSYSYITQSYTEIAIISAKFVERLLEHSRISKALIDNENTTILSNEDNGNMNAINDTRKKQSLKLNHIKLSLPLRIAQHLSESYEFSPLPLIKKHRQTRLQFKAMQNLKQQAQPIEHTSTTWHHKSSFFSKSISFLATSKYSNNGNSSSILFSRNRSACGDSAKPTTRTNRKLQTILMARQSNKSSFLPVITKTRGLLQPMKWLMTMKSNTFRVVWSSSMLFINVYYAIVTMIHFMNALKYFQTASSVVDYGIVVDYLFDCISFMDVVLRLCVFSSTIQNNSDLVTSRNQDIETIRQAFFKSKLFPIYIARVFPFDILAILWPQHLPIFRVNKLISVLLISSIIQELRDRIDYQYYQMQTHSKLDAATDWILLLKHMMMRYVTEESLAFIEQCLWIVIIISWFTSWWNTLHSYSALDDSVSHWISSAYWCFTTITTTGYGDIVSSSIEETLICLGNMFIGPTIFASIIAYVITFVQGSNAYDTWQHYRNKVSMQMLLHYSKFKGTLLDDTPRHSAAQAKYVNHQAIKLKSSPNKAFGRREDWLYNNGVPPSFKGWIREKLLKEMIKTTRIFRNCSDRFLHDLVLLLEQCHYHAHEMVSKNNKLYGLFFVKTGHVRMQLLREEGEDEEGNEIGCDFDSANRPEIKRFSGDMIGEDCILLPFVSIKVQAMVDSELWYLCHEQFQSLAKHSNYRSDIDQIKAYLKGSENGHRLSNKCKPMLSKQVPLTKQLSKLFQTRQKHQLRSEDIQLIQKRKKQEELASYGWILTSDHPFLRRWNMFLGLCVFYQFIVLPYRIGFPYAMKSVESWIYLGPDYLCDAIFMVDFLLHALSIDDLTRTTFSDRQQSDTHLMILKRYFSSLDCYLRLLFFFPFDIAFLIANPSISSGVFKPLAILQVIGLLRINRLLRIGQVYSSVYSTITLSATSLISIVSKGVHKYHKYMMKLGESMAMILLIAHIVGCIFMFIARLEEYYGESNWARTAGVFDSSSGVNVDNINNSNEILCVEGREAFSQYIASLYWAITVLTTVGYGDIFSVSKIEMIYNSIVFAFGTVLFGLIIGSFQSLTTETNYILDKHLERIQKLKLFLKREHLIGSIGKRTSVLSIVGRLHHEDNENKETNGLSHVLHHHAQFESLHHHQQHNHDSIPSSIDHNHTNGDVLSVWQHQLHHQVMQYYHKLWKYNLGEANESLSSLFTPDNTPIHSTAYTQLVQSLVQDDVKKLFLFVVSSSSPSISFGMNLETKFFNRLTFQFYHPNQILFYQGELADRLYFVIEGEVILTNNQDQLSTGSVCQTTTNYQNNVTATAENIYLSMKDNSNANVNPPSFRPTVNRKTTHRLQPSLTSTGLYRPPPLERNSDPLLLPSRFSVDSNFSSHLPRNQAPSNNKSLYYRKIQSGLLSEGEFFLQDVYSCHAQALSHCTVLEMKYTTFLQLLQEEGHLSHYHHLVKSHFTHLRRHSTCALVNSLDDNIDNRKMKQMMVVDLPPSIAGGNRQHTGWQRSWTAEDRWFCYWNHGIFLLLIMLLICVPLFIVFPNKAIFLWSNVSLDILWIISILLDLYLKAFHFDHGGDLDVAKHHLHNSHSHSVSSGGGGIRSMHDTYLLVKQQIQSYRKSPSWIVFEVCTCLPLIVFGITLHNVWYSISRLCYAYHLYRFSILLSYFLHAVPHSMTYYVQHIIGSVTTLLYVVHLSACGWIYLALTEESFGLTSWRIANNLSDNVMTYFTAYYWAIYTVTTVGYGNISVVTDSERIYALMVMMIGVVFTAYFSAILGSAVNYYFMHQNQSVSLHDSLFQYMKQYASSSSGTNNSPTADNNSSSIPLQTNLTNYCQYLQNELHNVEDEEGFALLPSSLRRDWLLPYCLHLFDYRFLFDHKITEVQHKGFLYSLLSHMQPYLAIPEEVLLEYNHEHKIYLEGEEDLFILRRGHVIAQNDCVERRVSNTEILNFLTLSEENDALITSSSSVSSPSVAKNYSLKVISISLFPSNDDELDNNSQPLSTREIHTTYISNSVTSFNTSDGLSSISSGDEEKPDSVMKVVSISDSDNDSDHSNSSNSSSGSEYHNSGNVHVRILSKLMKPRTIQTQSQSNAQKNPKAAMQGDVFLAQESLPYVLPVIEPIELQVFRSHAHHVEEELNYRVGACCFSMNVHWRDILAERTASGLNDIFRDTLSPPSSSSQQRRGSASKVHPLGITSLQGNKRTSSSSTPSTPATQKTSFQQSQLQQQQTRGFVDIDLFDELGHVVGKLRLQWELFLLSSPAVTTISQANAPSIKPNQPISSGVRKSLISPFFLQQSRSPPIIPQPSAVILTDHGYQEGEESSSSSDNTNYSECSDDENEDCDENCNKDDDKKALLKSPSQQAKAVSQPISENVANEIAADGESSFHHSHSSKHPKEIKQSTLKIIAKEYSHLLRVTAAERLRLEQHYKNLSRTNDDRLQRLRLLDHELLQEQEVSSDLPLYYSD